MKQTMLLADGDAELCDIYQRFSTERGYEVETTSDALDCVKKPFRMEEIVRVVCNLANELTE